MVEDTEEVTEEATAEAMVGEEAMLLLRCTHNIQEEAMVAAEVIQGMGILDLHLFPPSTMVRTKKMVAKK
jgi:hypothetical protein